MTLTDPALTPACLMILGAAALVGLLVAIHAASAAWRGWLDLRRLEIERRHGAADQARSPGTAPRIELADLRERVRKLEAIAAGVDL